MNGLILSGYGFSGVIYNFLSTALINPTNIPIDQERGFLDEPDVLDRIPESFIYLGIIALVILLFGFTGLNVPDDKYVQLNKDSQLEISMQPVISKPISETNDVNTTLVYTSNNMDNPYGLDTIDEICGYKLANPDRYLFMDYRFWNAGISFLFGGIALAYFASQWKEMSNRVFGIENDQILAIMGSVGSLFNGFSRIFWGFVWDKTNSYRKTVGTMFVFETLFLFTWPFLQYISNETLRIVCAYFWLAMLYFNITGQYPVYTAYFAKLYNEADAIIGVFCIFIYVHKYIILIVTYISIWLYTNGWNNITIY